jgi:GNAT superfamily N-acetyltransferase
MIIEEWRSGEFLFSADKGKLNIHYIHQFLSRHSYWAKGVPEHVVKKSIQNSLTFGIYHVQDELRQVGFARVITDLATFGYLGDVFVDEDYRKQGLSKKLMEYIFRIEALHGLRRIILATSDAHGLYSQFGFKPLKAPERFMEIHRPDVYKVEKS